MLFSKYYPFPAQNYYFFLIFANISLFSSLYFFCKLRTIHAQYTHYSNTFLSGSVAFESYSSIYCLSTTCLILGDFPPSKFSSTTLDGVLSRVSRLPNLLTLNSSECNERPLNRSFTARLYTLHLTLYTKKIARQGDFSCSIQNILLPLQPQTKSLQTYFIKSVCFI